MIPLENFKFRLVGKVLRDVDYHKADCQSHLHKDAYVFSTPDDEFYCCSEKLAAEDLQKLVDEKKVADFRNAEHEYISLGIFHDYTVMDLFPATCFAYWEERGLSEVDITGAIDLLMITLNYTVGTYEISLRDFNFFLFGLLLGSKKFVFDGPKSDLELAQILKIIFHRAELMEKVRLKEIEEMKQRKATGSKSTQ